MKATTSLTCMIALMINTAYSSDITLPEFPGSQGIRINNIGSLESEKFKHVVKQETDYSCGAASLATILRYAYNYDIHESDVMDGMFKLGDSIQIQKRGFSLLDMKKFLDAINFESKGFRVDIEGLKKASVPAIILINQNNYSHFVVLKNILNDTVHIADPSIGNRAIPIDEFKNIWELKIVFNMFGDNYFNNNPLIQPVDTPSPNNSTIQGNMAGRLDFGIKPWERF